MGDCDNKKIYIAREYLICDDYGSIRIDEEAIFSTYDKALSFIHSLEDHDVNENRLFVFRLEIVELPIDEEDADSYSKRWVYSIDGKLIEKYPETETETEIEIDQISYQKKFDVGDIVYIKPKIHEPLSPSLKGDFAVIVEIPFKKEEWVNSGRNEADWNCMYIVNYVTDTGTVDHKHAYEQVLSKPPYPLPEELKFLQIYSNHLKSKQELPKEFIDNLLKDIVFVKKSKIFDFKSGSVKQL